MTIYRSIDAEDAVRSVLTDCGLTAYCPPLPADFTVPCILAQDAGGNSFSTASGKGKVDTFLISLDARAETESEAKEYIRNAVAVLETTRGEGISHVALNSLYSWGSDPVRPDLAMCSAAILVTAHRETVTI